MRSEYGQARPPVRGTVNGYPFRTTVAVYGGTSYIGFRREIREGAAISPGDTVVIELERDDAPREVAVPDDLAAALNAQAGLRDASTGCRSHTGGSTSRRLRTRSGPRRVPGGSGSPWTPRERN